MLHTIIFDQNHKPTNTEKQEIVDFLHTHLEEYGDPKKDIQKAIEYSVNEHTSFGGFSMLLTDRNQIVGAAVVNKTGMEGYIPENILVYLATHIDHRGKGLGKALMQNIIDTTTGDIALHVGAGNPAQRLYEKMGFTNPYLEMRLKKQPSHSDE
ncbi:GNAT family N-acetyltransferase [Reichenbachiella sp. 5M10]|uniref:GNAT family N-acetyltransferase n=1 Tax=Reichenbachiella sp. 5M10 TaxID=1889772 RepID=UPI000C14E164|nr:GNAT family N-acetyltransferase [Reichenbachiella sp. 5M10]PIB35127.1 GNAT family N-acetyltransferase [Reichenbachiella sp. 5M10]